MHEKAERQRLKSKILYNRQDLLDIIELMGLDKKKSEKERELVKKIVNEFLIIMDKQISIIRECSSLEFTKASADKIQKALSKIHKSADLLTKVGRHVDESLQSSLKIHIKSMIKPIEDEVKRKLLNLESGISDEELQQGTIRLYNEQKSLNEPLTKHLAQIKKLFSEYTKHRCFIAYVPPTDRNKCEEAFLSILYDHLTAAGIRPIMELRDNSPGNNWYRFMRDYCVGIPIILIGTESLYDSAQQMKVTELTIIHNTIKTRPDLIYPLLISGHAKTAFPDEYHFDSNIIDGQNGYIGILKELMLRLLKIEIQQKEEAYNQLWEKFDKALNVSIHADTSPAINYSSDRFFNEVKPKFSGETNPEVSKESSKEEEVDDGAGMSIW